MENALNKAWKKGFETATGDMDEIMNNKDATIASLTAEVERLREAAEKALHILQYCPDKQEKAVALLSAALQPKEGAA